MVSHDILSPVLRILIFAAFPSGALASIKLTPLKVLPITYQSSGLSFDEWTSLFTLCFAPLIAHLVAGVPKVVYLSPDKPDWRQYLGLYNPTTILWRYFAIADRRIRAKHWSAAELCAINVYFWTPRGWDGSEAMPRESREYCVVLPENTHATLLSWDTVQTLIVSLQGAAAMYALLLGLIRPSESNPGIIISLSTLFFPLAILGLLRIIACFWLTSDFTYVNLGDLQTPKADEVPATAEYFKSNALSKKTKLSLVPRHPMYKASDFSESRTGEDYMSPNTWQSRLLRGSFLLPILGLTVLGIFYLLPTGGGTILVNSTTFLVEIFFLFFLLATTIIFAFYFVRGDNTTTILPCVSSLWYQLYTGVLMALMLAIITIAAIETRFSQCGNYYTTYSSSLDRCGIVTVASEYNGTRGGVFGLAVMGNIENSNFYTDEESINQTNVVFFNGWCAANTWPTGTQDFQFVGNFTPS